MNYFYIDVELNGSPVHMLISDVVPVGPGERKEISFQVHYASPEGARELLLVLRENGWVNEPARIEPAGLPLLWQRFPEMIEPHMLPDEIDRRLAGRSGSYRCQNQRIHDAEIAP
jgi:hypothetical protein